MICPVCGSSNIYVIHRRYLTEPYFYCHDCDHAFDREDVKDANENREESE